VGVSPPEPPLVVWVAGDKGRRPLRPPGPPRHDLLFLLGTKFFAKMNYWIWHCVWCGGCGLGIFPLKSRPFVHRWLDDDGDNSPNMNIYGQGRRQLNIVLSSHAPLTTKWRSVATLWLLGRCCFPCFVPTSIAVFLLAQIAFCNAPGASTIIPTGHVRKIRNYIS
jgi:hypothetical protein